MIRHTPSAPRDVILLDPFDRQPASAGIVLPLWVADPVARRYTEQTPTQRVPLTHTMFSEARLYRDEGAGGAVILCTPELRVLALDYSNADDLTDCWRDTLSHYLSTGLQSIGAFCA